MNVASGCPEFALQSDVFDPNRGKQMANVGFAYDQLLTKYIGMFGQVNASFAFWVRKNCAFI